MALRSGRKGIVETKRCALTDRAINKGRGWDETVLMPDQPVLYPPDDHRGREAARHVYRPHGACWQEVQIRGYSLIVDKPSVGRVRVIRSTRRRRRWRAGWSHMWSITGAVAIWDISRMFFILVGAAGLWGKI